MSPAPIPAAATSNPGPISLAALVVRVDCSSVNIYRSRIRDGIGAQGSVGSDQAIPNRSRPNICAMNSTAAVTAKLLADAGTERVFGLPGGEVLVLMDELRRVGV